MVGINGDEITGSLETAQAILEMRIAELEFSLSRAQRDIEKLESRFNAMAQAGPKHVNSSPAGFPYLTRGHQISFAHGGDGAPHLASGWWACEDWGVWGAEGQHAIRFAVDDSYLGGYIEVQMTVQVTMEPASSPPNISVTANGFFLLSSELRGYNKRLQFRIPPSAFEDGDVLLCLNYDCPISGNKLTNNGDERLLGVGLISMKLL